MSRIKFVAAGGRGSSPPLPINSHVPIFRLSEEMGTEGHATDQKWSHIYISVHKLSQML